jgi:NADH:ubiquinone oxidoreductase subunit 6 (subunit J)
MLEKIPHEAFFALYLIIASNYIADLFSCKFREFLSNSMLIKHIICLCMFGFLVILSKSGIDLDKNNAYVEALIITLLLYIWFVLTTRTHVYITLVILLLFFVMYLISYRIKHLKTNKKSTKQLELINKYILICCAIITIIGVINYGFLKNKELNKRNEKFNFYTFFIGNIRCRNDKIDKII